jgi:hypothetical protein
MLNRIFIVFFSFISASCYSQVDYGLLKNWKIHEIPSNSDTLRKYNNSVNDWSVFIRNNTLTVIKRKQYDDQSILPFDVKPKGDEKSKMSGRISLIKVEDGYLVGFNRGEWGGYLYWFSKDGSNHYLISNDQVVQFINKKGQNYAIQGLAHLTMSEGSIIKIEKKNNKWLAHEYVSLPTAPEAIGLDIDDNFLIMTSKSLLKIEDNKKIQTLIGRGFWYDDLTTNSMVISNNIIYAGMTAGVFKYDLSNGKQEWLLPY